MGILEQEPQVKDRRVKTLGLSFSCKRLNFRPLNETAGGWLDEVKSEFSRHWQKLRVRRPAAEIYVIQRSRTVGRGVMA